MIDISGIVGGPGVIMAAIRERFATHKTVRVDDAMLEGASIVKKTLHKYFYDYIKPKLSELHEYHQLMQGEYDDKWPFYRREEFSDSLDEQVETLLDNNAHMITADWLGNHVTETRLWEENAVHNFADGFAVDAVKVATWRAEDENAGPKTPAQILSAVGIVKTDIETMLNDRIQPTTEQVEQAVQNNMQEAAQRMHDTIVMMGYTGKELELMVDNASDSDEGLAQGGVQNLGGEWPGDWNAMKDGRSQWGVQGLANFLEQYSGVIPAPDPQVVEAEPDPYAEFGATTPTPKAPPLPAGATPPPAPAKRGRKKQADTEGCVPPELLMILKQHTGEDTNVLAAALGLSRQTFDNYAKGKGALKPDVKQAKTISDLLELKQLKLREAIGLLESIMVEVA